MQPLAEYTPERWVQDARLEGPFDARDLRGLRRVIDETEDLQERKFYLQVYKLVEQEVTG